MNHLRTKLSQEVVRNNPEYLLETVVGRTRLVRIQGSPEPLELVTTARLNVRGSQAHVSMRYLLTYRNDSSLFIAGLDHRPIDSCHNVCRLKTLRQRLLTRGVSPVAGSDTV